jgi:hypothetical protein
MSSLTEYEKKELIRLLNDGQPLPGHWRHRLFPSESRAQDTGKEYRLVYDGKLKRESFGGITFISFPRKITQVSSDRFATKPIRAGDPG